VLALANDSIEIEVDCIFKKIVICQFWIDDIGFSLTPTPLISPHIVNLHYSSSQMFFDQDLVYMRQKEKWAL
jgi:hypothetical protein